MYASVQCFIWARYTNRVIPLCYVDPNDKMNKVISVVLSEICCFLLIIRVYNNLFFPLLYSLQTDRNTLPKKGLEYVKTITVQAYV